MSSEKPNWLNKTFVLRLAGTLLALGMLVFLLFEQGWQDISAAFLRIPISTLSIALGLTMLSRLAVTGRWYVLLRTSGVKVTALDTARLTFAGLFAANFLPTTIGGDVVRLAGAVQVWLDGALSAASLIADRLIGMAGMAMTLPWGLARLFESPQLIEQGATSIGVAQGMALALPGRWLRRMWTWGLDVMGRIFGALKTWMRQPVALFWGLVFTWMHMVCIFLSIWLILDAMGEPVPFMLLAGLWSLVYFVTLLPVSINGYGLQELSMTVVFTRLAGVSPEASLMIALLHRTLMMVCSLPGAVFVPGIIAASKNQPKQGLDS